MVSSLRMEGAGPSEIKSTKTNAPRPGEPFSHRPIHFQNGLFGLSVFKSHQPHFGLLWTVEG
jgi:hypothetical protein